MENIDWSEIIEDAEFAGSIFGEQLPVFYKNVTDSSYEYHYPCAAGWSGKIIGQPACTPLIPRPSTSWSGQGRPPVGTVCEGGRARTGAFNECVVIAHRNGMAIAVFTDQEELQWVTEFRPIRTPEQIAKDEREAAIKEMTAGYADNSEALAGWAAYVYDTLGYRKP